MIKTVNKFKSLFYNKVFSYLPREIKIELTHRCNLRCKHCYWYGEDSYPISKGKELSFEQIKKFLNGINKKIY